MLSLHRESWKPGAVNLSQLLDSVTELIQETIAKRKRVIQTDYQFDGTIGGFTSDLFQVFTNLLKNAVEATSGGGKITVSLGCRKGLERPGFLSRYEITEWELPPTCIPDSLHRL